MIVLTPVSYEYESICIDSAKLSSDGTFVIIVRNTGDVKATVDTIYLLDYLTSNLVARAELFYVNGNQYDKIAVEPNSVVEIHGTFGVTVWGTFTIKVVTLTGVEASVITIVRS